MQPIIQNIITVFKATLLVLLCSACDSFGSKESAISPQTGTGGSMARFAITGNTLYVVGKSNLNVYDITTPENPHQIATKKMDMGVETIFPYQDKLFIGANDGMYIFDNAQPTNPKLLSKYTHVLACDPVVVQGNYAYVTLRGGRACGNWVTQSVLQVIDISNPSQPQQVGEMRLDNPYGLGVNGDRLFVCERDKGLTVIDITTPQQPRLRFIVSNVKPYDAIVRKDSSLLLSGDDGIYQMVFKEGNNYEILSKIPVL